MIFSASNWSSLSVKYLVYINYDLKGFGAGNVTLRYFG